MKEISYKQLGFKSGLEIHSQLDGKKLFCSCPVKTNKKEEPDLVIKRKIRSVAGEEGKKDIATLHEEKKDLTFNYEFYHDCNCLVELDEEPPHEINQEALEAALQISLLLKAKPIKKIKVMRKIIVDGSNVTGFQRTMLIAENGKLKTSKGIVKIPTILLEEEAAKKISKNKNEVTYRLDRLGVPLIEIATSADIKDPEHAKETASLIGMILHSTPLVKRGLGTIRQDVNLSIKNSPRMEIKGFQDLKSIPKIIEFEVNRLILDKPKKPEVRKANPDLTTSFLRPLPGEARFYPETDVPEVNLDKKLLKSIKLPETLAEKSLSLEKKYKLSPELAKEVIENKIHLESLTKKYNKISPTDIANILIEKPKEIKSRFNSKYQFKEKDFTFVLTALNKNKINKDIITEILLDLSKNKKPNLNKYKPVNKKNIEAEIEKIIAENSGASPNALMGIAMKKFQGKVSGKELFELLKKYQ